MIYMSASLKFTVFSVISLDHPVKFNAVQLDNFISLKIFTEVKLILLVFS